MYLEKKHSLCRAGLLVFGYYLSVPPCWLSFQKRWINLDQILCRSVTFREVICMFEKDSRNISDTSLPYPNSKYRSSHQPHPKTFKICILKYKFDQYI